jgi:heparan-alpha-glucosaminide N-acetyltransferase
MSTLTMDRAQLNPVAPVQTTSERLVSLDAFRGLTMLLLISHGFGIYEAFKNPQFEHAAWVGCTLWDLIQPAFTFMVGVAMPIALSRRSNAARHVLWRAAVLLALSNILSNWGTQQGLKLQFINVLCQIAFSYVLCYAILQLKFAWQVAAATAIMIGHHALFYLWPGPTGPFDQTGNIGAVIDLKLLGYNYPGYYTTINFLGNGITVLFGCWTGLLMLSKRPHMERIKILLGCSVGVFALGMVLANWIPMVKRLWLGSFTFFSAGWVLAAFALCYWIIEVRGIKRWAFPLVVVGMNCIFIYSFSQVLRGWLSRGIAPFDGGQFAMLGPAGAIPHNLIVMAIMWGLCYWLYQRKIFFKI